MTDASIATEPDASRTQDTLSPVGLWIVTLAGVAAAAIAGYLTWQSLVMGVLPAGCGEGSGCGEVLTSKYARLWDIPVSAMALVAYAVLVGLVIAGRKSHAPLLWNLVMTLSVAILGSAGWFVYLQLGQLKAICSWCMTDHALGTVAAVGAIGLAVSRRGQIGHTPLINGVMAGLALAAVLAISQWASAARVILLEGVEVSLLDDRFNINVAAEPHLGLPTAEKQLFILLDYACPHCKVLHERVTNLQARREDLVLVFLPTSIEPACNPLFDTVADRFIGSCKRAELALAVHLADPEQFAAFDQWLYEWDNYQPPSVEDARAYAESLVGRERLAEVLADGLPGKLLERNVAILAATTAGHVPVLIVPGQPPIVGRVDDDAPIEALLSGSADVEQ